MDGEFLPRFRARAMPPIGRGEPRGSVQHLARVVMVLAVALAATAVWPRATSSNLPGAQTVAANVGARG